MNHKLLLTSFLVSASLSSHLYALDARSIALGGSTVSNGQGVHGALENPANLMHMKDLGQRGHFHWGGTLDLRDSGGIIETADDNEGLVDDFESEIDTITGQSITCDVLTATADTVCVSNTSTLGNLSSRVLDILNDVDGQSLDAQGTSDIGFANTNMQFPFAIHFRGVVTGQAIPQVAEGDKEYSTVIADTLQDGTLTFGEISDNIQYAINNGDGTVSLATPETTLESTGEAAALFRFQVGFSLASTVELGGHTVDVGITPKFSKLTAGYVDISIAEQFEDNSESVSDQFEDSEVDENSTTFDLGMGIDLPNKPIRLSAVLRNVIPESVDLDGFRFETTTQLVAAGSYQMGNTTFNADVALNKAKSDNFESQKIGLGVEWTRSWLALRAGLSHDAARDDSATALSAGVGLGPVHLGGRLTESNEAQFGMQLSFSY